jgi:hypothetical protein
MKDPEDKKTLEIDANPKKYVGRGGWRDGGRPKADYQTITMRVDTRLKKVVAALRERLKSGVMDEEELKVFEELAAN